MGNLVFAGQSCSRWAILFSGTDLQSFDDYKASLIIKLHRLQSFDNHKALAMVIQSFDDGDTKLLLFIKNG